MKISDVFKGLVCITGIVIPCLACAQNFEIYPIEFLSQHTISNSYAGGMVSLQFSEMDINMDGKKDMIVFEKSSAIFIPYINEGESGNIKYRFDHSVVKLFPEVQRGKVCPSWDPNCDCPMGSPSPAGSAGRKAQFLGCKAYVDHLRDDVCQPAYLLVCSAFVDPQAEVQPDMWSFLDCDRLLKPSYDECGRCYR